MTAAGPNRLETLKVSLVGHVDRMVAPQLRARPFDLVRARLVVVFSATWFVVGTIVSTAHLSYGATTVGLGLGAVTITAPASVLVLRRTLRFSLASHVMAAQLATAIAWNSYFVGGTDSIALPFVAVLPLMTLLIDRIRSAGVWLVVAVSVVSGFYLMQAAGYPFPMPPSPRPAWVELLGLLVLVGVVFAFATVDYRVKKSALRDAEDARAAAESANVAKSIFLANMSHELRTPMNGVIGGAELLASTSVDADQETCIGMILGSGKSMLAIIDDILDLAKIESGNLELEQVPFDVRKALGELRSILLPAAMAKGIDLEVSVDETVPASVLGDVVRFKQIVTNLAANAIKFTAEGRVAVRVRSEGSVVHVDVEDSGIGIKPARLKSIFEPFVQADSSTTRKYGGTGLGLAISQQLVAAYGGEMVVDSEPGRGSCFSFTAVLPPAPVAPAPAVRRDDPTPSALSVLIVEDNAVNQRVCAKMLERRGHSYQIANHGKEALALLEEHTFDVVLMDCQMPELDGFETTEAIRTRPWDRSEIPIIALTANALPDDRAKCEAAGMDGYLSKPVRPADLQAALMRYTTVTG